MLKLLLQRSSLFMMFSSVLEASLLILSVLLLVLSLLIIGWCSGVTPLSGFSKLSVDWSAFHNLGKVGFDGLLTNDNGEWLASFPGFIGSSTRLHSKLKEFAFWSEACLG